MDQPLDGANGENGLFWHPSSFNPINFYRSFARTQHYDSISRPNYQVLTGYKVNKIIFAPNTTHAIGVQFTSREASSQSLVVKASKEIIISAGTVHTPQVLQLSGIGPKDSLEKAGIEVRVELPGVGANFQDHAFLNVGYVCEHFLRG
jgi:choline dehydrogenase